MVGGATKSDWAYCQNMLPKVSRTFALNIGQLEGDTYKAVLLGYLLFRMADTFEDNLYQNEKEKIADLLDFAGIFKGAKGLSRRMHIFEPLKFRWEERSFEKDLIENGCIVLRCYFDIPEVYRRIIDPLLVETSEGMAEFQRRKLERKCKIFQLTDIQELEDYCYYVAGVVGVMLTKVFCLQDSIKERRSELEDCQIHFGLALQMINIIKDYWKDIARGWCYIPFNITRSCCMDLNKIEALSVDQKKSILQGIIPRLVQHLDLTLKYIQVLPLVAGSIREFCIIPFVIGYRTLVRVVEMEGNKISRREVACIMNRAAAFAKSNDALEEDYVKTKKRYLSAGMRLN